MKISIRNKKWIAVANYFSFYFVMNISVKLNYQYFGNLSWCNGGGEVVYEWKLTTFQEYFHQTENITKLRLA